MPVFLILEQLLEAIKVIGFIRNQETLFDCELRSRS